MTTPASPRNLPFALPIPCISCPPFILLCSRSPRPENNVLPCLSLSLCPSLLFIWTHQSRSHSPLPFLAILNERSHYISNPYLISYLLRLITPELAENLRRDPHLADNALEHTMAISAHHDELSRSESSSGITRISEFSKRIISSIGFLVTRIRNSIFVGAEGYS